MKKKDPVRGFLEERGGADVHMRYELEVLRTAEWLEMARAEIELHERTEPQTIEDARPRLDLPAEGKTSTPEPAGPVPEQGGCQVTLP